MPFVLILSSQVAASRVGGMAQVLALQPFGIDTALVPTVLFGRHPGWGPPGGAAVDPVVMAGMLDGIEAQGLFALTDAVITGYFSTPAQVEVAADAIARVRAANPRTRVVIDPVLGDEGRGLYVKPEVAVAVRDSLVPLADLVAPNRFELGWLLGEAAPETAEGAAILALRLGKPVLVSSVQTSGPDGADEIGVLYVAAREAVLALHARVASAPNGTGDVLTALFTAALIDGLKPTAALGRSVAGVAELVGAALAWNAPELPLVAAAQRLVSPTAPVRLLTLS
jgi:pyridoxine kinase